MELELKTTLTAGCYPAVSFSAVNNEQPRRIWKWRQLTVSETFRRYLIAFDFDRRPRGWIILVIAVGQDLRDRQARQDQK
jgi:hypothetical protein